MLQHKILEDLEEAIENSEEFTISTRRRESVLDGSANTRDSVYHLVFRYEKFLSKGSAVPRQI